MKVTALARRNNCAEKSALQSFLMSLYRQQDIDVGRQECLPHPQTADVDMIVIAMTWRGPKEDWYFRPGKAVS